MAAINKKTEEEPIFTAPGARAVKISPLLQLRRTVMSCLLWEDIAYEDGETVAERVKSLVHSVSLEEAASIAIEARESMNLRHVPLLIVREMARHPNLAKNPRVVSETLTRVIQRPDELTEFLAIYWKDKKQPLSSQVKIGLGKAFSKFNEYSLAKYNGDKDIKLKDVLFLCHAKPKDVPETDLPWDKAARASVSAYDGSGFSQGPASKETMDARIKEIRPEGFTEGEVLFGKIVYDQLATPDTWEVELSAGKDKKTTFERLMDESKLGDLAFLRNLRNMVASGVNQDKIIEYGDSRKWGRVLPFRFISAARVAPSLEPHIESWMLKGLADAPKLSGSTLLVVDVSGSMCATLSAKSELKRIDAAAALITIAREICEKPVIYVTAGNDGTRIHKTALVPARKGFALIDYIIKGEVNVDLGGGGIFLAQCLDFINTEQNGKVFDRVMVFTDEQDCDKKLNPASAKLLGNNNYMINISTEKNGIGYRKWTHIDGFSETVIDFISRSEAQYQGG